MYLYISASVARPRFPSWSSSIHCLYCIHFNQDPFLHSLSHLSSFPCSYLLPLSHPLIPLSVIHWRCVRALLLSRDQVLEYLVSELYVQCLSASRHLISWVIDPPQACICLSQADGSVTVTVTYRVRFLLPFTLVSLPPLQMYEGRTWYLVPESGCPKDLPSLAKHLNAPDLPLLIQQFLFDQLNPDEPPAVQQPLVNLPDIQSNISVFHSAHAIFHAPSNISGSQGMHHQIIWSTSSWCQKDAHYNCVLVVEDQDKPGMRGMIVGRVCAFLSFSFNDTIYPCALIDCFKQVGWAPDPITGMWKVQPELRGSQPVRAVVHLETILCNVHLIPVFSMGYIPWQLHYSQSLDVFSSFYVNKYADHHSFEVVT